jgi:hypothetical protein
MLNVFHGFGLESNSLTVPCDRLRTASPNSFWPMLLFSKVSLTRFVISSVFKSPSKYVEIINRLEKLEKIEKKLKINSKLMFYLKMSLRIFIGENFAPCSFTSFQSSFFIQIFFISSKIKQTNKQTIVKQNIQTDG